MIERYTRPRMGQVWSEEHKYRKWLQVEIAVCEAWAELGAIPQEAMPAIRGAGFDLARIQEHFRETHHDVTAFLRAVQETVGEHARFIHLGLTSSDVWDTATALQLVEACDVLAEDVAEVVTALEQRAREHKYTLMAGRTHGVQAEPITFGLKLALWREEMRRNAERLAAARQAVAVGKISGAVGTYASVPPQVEEVACARLGLAPEPISNQIVQRDRHAQLVTTLAIIGGSLERCATELRGLQRTEILETEEPFEEGQTGSSAMPHKRNPELLERICGQARLLRGYATTALENMALWGERDISHSSTERIILPDAAILLDYMLGTFAYVVRGLQVYPEHMRENLERTQGLVFSQRVLLALIEQGGMGRQEAYKIVQRNAMRAWRERTPFFDLLAADPDVAARLSREQLQGLFDYGYYLRHVDAIYTRLGFNE
ncbi:MAG: adenylosuccinate lyase [Chloroflexi bacterium]|nr:adenylosuccinate lyase [Chloroflexota bacterium]